MISINIAIAFLLLPQVFAGLIHKEQTSNGYLFGDELATYHSRLTTYRIRQAAIVYHIVEDGREQIDFDLLNDLERDERILEAAISFHRYDKGLHLQRDSHLVILNDQERTVVPHCNTSDLQAEQLMLSDAVKIFDDQQKQIEIGNSSVFPSKALGFQQGRHFMDDSNDDISLICPAEGTNLDGSVGIGENSASLLRSDYHNLKEDDSDVLTTFDEHLPQMIMIAGNQTVILPSYSDPTAGFDQGHLIVDVDSNDELSLRPLGFTKHASSICENVNNDDANTDDEAADRDPFDESVALTTISDLSANHFQSQRFVGLLDLSGRYNGVIIAHLELQRSLVMMTVRNCCFIVADVDPDHYSMLAQPFHVLRRIKGVIYCGCPLANELPNNADVFATLSGLPAQQRNFDDISMLSVHQADFITIISCCTVIGDAAIHLRSDVKLSRDDDDDIITQIYHCCSCASGEEFVHIVPIIKQPLAPAPAPTDTPPPLDP